MANFINSIVSIKGLKALDLSRNKFSQDIMAELLSKLNVSSDLETLSMSHASITDELTE